MDQSNNKQDSDKIVLDKDHNSFRNDAVQVLPVHLNINVDVPKNHNRSRMEEYAKKCSAIVDKFFDKILTVSFPPGKFETPYRFSLDFKDIVSSQDVDVKISLLWSLGFESKGLTCRYDDDVLSISGTSDNPKGFDGEIRFVLDGSFYGIKECGRRGFSIKSSFKEIKIGRKFVLNPDPESLWKDIPTKENAPFPKPNNDVQCTTTATEPSLTVLGASQRGRSHAQVGSFRDDHFLIRLGENPDDWNFVTVADGAGSARFSREGSKIACETCINDPKTGLATLFNFFKDAVDQEINSILDSSTIDYSRKLTQTNLEKYFYHSVRYAGEAIVTLSKQENAKLSDFNTTLLCAAFKRLPKTEQTPARWVVLSYWVGDGGLAILRPNGKDDVLPLGTPDGGEYAGQTRFLTMSSELSQDSICGRLRLAVVEDFQALVLATDGITDPFFPAEANLSDYTYWQKFWNETLPKEFPGVLDTTKTLEERGKALLDGLMFRSKGNHDDRTLVLVLNDAFQKSQEAVNEISEIAKRTDSVEAVEKGEKDELCDTTGVGEVDEHSRNDEKANVESVSAEMKEADSPDEANGSENRSSENVPADVPKNSLEPTCDTADDSEQKDDSGTSENLPSEETATERQKTDAENPCDIMEGSEQKDDSNASENPPSEETATERQKTNAENPCDIMEGSEQKDDSGAGENLPSEENATERQKTDAENPCDIMEGSEQKDDSNASENPPSEETATECQKTETENSGCIMRDPEPENAVEPLASKNGEVPDSNTGINSADNESVTRAKIDEDLTVKPTPEKVAESEPNSELQNVETKVSDKSTEGNESAFL